MPIVWDDEAPVAPTARTSTTTPPRIVWDDERDPNLMPRLGATVGVLPLLSAVTAPKRGFESLVSLSTKVPSFQTVSQPLGDIVRTPLEALNLPTTLSSQVLPRGFPGRDIFTEAEKQAQNTAMAAFADTIVWDAVPATVGSVVRGADRLRGALAARGIIRPEVLPSRIPPRPAVRPTGPIVEAELFEPPKALPFLPPEADIPAKAQAFVTQNLPKLVAEYRAKNGNLISGDLARELLRPVGYNRANAGEFKQASAPLLEAIFKENLAAHQTNKQQGVLFISGGNGSGKSQLLQQAQQEPFAFSMEIMPHDLNLLRRKITEALEAGYPVTIKYIYRDPVEAFADGVIPRSIEKGAINEGRIVTIDEHIQNHLEGPKNFLKLQEQFGDRIAIDVEQSVGEGQFIPGTLDLLRQERYTTNDLRRILTNAVKLSERSGRISPDLAAAYLGANQPSGQGVLGSTGTPTAGQPPVLPQPPLSSQAAAPAGTTRAPIVSQSALRLSNTFQIARKQAIFRLTRELRQQAVEAIQMAPNLRKAVRELGGIDPAKGGGLREEILTNVPRFLLRTGGRPIDQMATELSQYGFQFEGANDLLEALRTSQSIKLPTLQSLRSEAERIVDSAQGQLLTQAISAKTASQAGIKRMMRDITRQMERELSENTRQVQRLLRAAEKKSLTPAQVARIARTQRAMPGEKVVGPRGGGKEAPLSPADVAQIEQRTSGIVARPGQPTGTPPTIPTSTALIPAEAPRPVRDLNQLQSTPFSGLEPSRAAELIDGTPQGPTQQRVLTPLRRSELSFRQEQRQRLVQLQQISRGLREGSPESQQVFQYLEGRRPLDQLTPRAQQTAQWMAGKFDALLNRVNQARASIGRSPILRREGYITHLKTPSLWEAMRETFSNADPEATKTLETEFFRRISGRIPFFRFGLPRKGGPFEEDAVKAFKAYLPAALRVIHLSEPSRLATVYVNRSLAGTPNAHKYFSQLIRQVSTGEAGPVAQLTPGLLLRASNWLRRRFGKGAVLGNLSSVLQQPFTLPATVSATGTDASTAAAAWIARGDGMSFALQWSPTLQARSLQVDVDLSTLASKWDQAMGAMFQAADRAMVSHAFLSGYLSGVKRGMTFDQAIAEGERVALRTQSGFLEADLAPVFRDAITGSAMQFQTTINGVFNFLKFDIPRTKNPWWAAGAFVGTFAAMWAIYEALGLPHPDRISEFVPGWSTVRGGGPVGLRMVAQLSALGDRDPRKRAEAFRALQTTGAALFGAGGNQIKKSFEGLKAVTSGGKFDKRGRRLFRVEGPAESARAMAFGPYGTKSGQAYVRRGFKPEPLTEEQKLLNRRLNAMRRRLMPSIR